MTSELEFYARPGQMTDLASVADLVAHLPTDIRGLSDIVEGFLIHPFWLESYGISVPDERQAELQIRPAADVLRAALALDEAPLTTKRPPERRVLGNCRDFSTVTTALLRHQGTPARARCGFGAYFERGKFIDHWIVERWDGERWVGTDAQIDDVQGGALDLRFDPLDVPKDAFIDGGRAWQMVRRGEADGETFGILDMWGPWFIRGNLMKDIASLNKVELLPWDAWNIDAEQPTDEYTDHVAAVCATANFDEVRALYETDPYLRVPDEITSFLSSGPVSVRI